MESRIQQLEEIVRVLEKRIAALEAKPSTRSSPAASGLDKVAWRKLKKDMSKDEVEQLLGSPSKIDEFGSFSIWNYRYPSGKSGTVNFDEEMNLDGWHEP
jgi:outer membrane protein assembly factor BamE (lipoprotein component of BamABCDE complex)